MAPTYHVNPGEVATDGLPIYVRSARSRTEARLVFGAGLVETRCLAYDAQSRRSGFDHAIIVPEVPA